jgi:hypothetical protein
MFLEEPKRIKKIVDAAVVKKKSGSRICFKSFIGCCGFTSEEMCK